MIATTRIIVGIFFFGFILGIALSYLVFKTEELKYRIQVNSKMQEARLTYSSAHGIEYESVAEVNAFILGYSNGQFIPNEMKTTTTSTATTSTTTIRPNTTTTTPNTSTTTPNTPTTTPNTTTTAPKTTNESVGSVSDHSKNEELHLGEDREAVELSNSVRILCFVLTSPKSHKQKAIHVKRTWGKRCTILLFVTTEADPELEPVLIVENIQENRKFLWAKTKHAIRAIYKHYMDQADWFLKADDDTYIVMENLRYMLRNHDPNKTHYFGHTFHPKWLGYDYMSGGAGYVLSKQTIKRLVEEAFPSKNTSQCKPDHVNGTELSEDLEIGRCINLLEIPSSDSRDALGRLRFFPFSPDIHIFHSKLNTTEFDWWWKYTKYSHGDGLECCSDTAVAFHYVTPKEMYLYEYFLYHLRPFGINRIKDAAESIMTTTENSVYSDEQMQTSDDLGTKDDEETTTESTKQKITLSPASKISWTSTLKNNFKTSTASIILKISTSPKPQHKNLSIPSISSGPSKNLTGNTTSLSFIINSTAPSTSNTTI